MLTHGVARLSSDSHAECRELPWKLCGIMREELPACKVPVAEAPAIAVETKRNT
jgi:hypothetical protein